MSDLLDHWDLSAITTVYEEEERGDPPYHPVMLTKVLVYGDGVGGVSSRRIQRRWVEDVGFRVLAAGHQPDVRTMADVRRRHVPAVQGFFEPVLHLARELGAARVGRVALEGTQVNANASKHQAMSDDRMRDQQPPRRAAVKEWLAPAEVADAAEAAEYGMARRGDERPAELPRRERRLTRIRDARRALEARAKEATAAAGQSVELAKPARTPPTTSPIRRRGS